MIIRLWAHHLNVFVRRHDEPQRKDFEGQEANEEEDDNRAQHRHHLATSPQVWVDVVCSGRYRRRRLHLNAVIGGGARIGDQVAGDDAVDEDEDNQREQEKEADGCDVIENGPECVGLRHTAG